MTGVKEQENLLRIHGGHEAVDFLNRLHAGSHVMMHGQRHALFLGECAELIVALDHSIPLRIGPDGLLVAEDIDVLALDGVALFAGTDHSCAECVETVAVSDEVADGDFIGLGGEERGEPGIADLQAADVQLVLEHLHILGILVADFASLEAGERHFAHALFKGVLSAQVGHVIIGPADRGNRQFDFVGIEHIRFLP